MYPASTAAERLQRPTGGLLCGRPGSKRREAAELIQVTDNQSRSLCFGFFYPGLSAVGTNLQRTMLAPYASTIVIAGVRDNYMKIFCFIFVLSLVGAGKQQR
jgi:hypothetical protein